MLARRAGGEKHDRRLAVLARPVARGVVVPGSGVRYHAIAATGDTAGSPRSGMGDVVVSRLHPVTGIPLSMVGIAFTVAGIPLSMVDILDGLEQLVGEEHRTVEFDPLVRDDGVDTGPVDVGRDGVLG